MHRNATICLTCVLFAAVLSPWGVQAEDSVERSFLRGVRQVTSGYVRAGEGYFSPDGQTIVYQAIAADYPFYQIYTQPLDGGGVEAAARLVSTGRGRTTCSFFSPDGMRILYASSHLDPQLSETEERERQRQAEDAKRGVRRRYDWSFDPHYDIFEADLHGRVLRRLTSEYGYDAEGSWSADGKQIVFCSDRDGDPDLYIMDADGTNVRQLTNAPGYDGGPFFSPDGKFVIFRSDRSKPEMLQIYCIGVDGQNETALTQNDLWVHWAPYWHPTQPYLIWTAADHSQPDVRPNYDLWLARYSVAQGRLSIEPPLRVTDHPAADVLPVFSPDGKRLMWTSNRTADHSSQLFIADFLLPE